MTQENCMTLGTLIAALQTMANALGESAMVDVDIEFSIDDDPAGLGTIKTSAPVLDGRRLYRIEAVQPEKPVFRHHGEAVVRDRLQKYALTAGAILAGMDGYPFTWSESTRLSHSRLARHMGITLITRSFADDLGLRVIDGQQPVGSGQFDWGRKRKPFGQLYVMEYQMEPEPVQSVSTETEENPQ